jgi:hypothetical protein
MSVSDSGGFDLVFGFTFVVEVKQYQKSNIKNENDKSKSEMTTEIQKPKH